MKNKLNLLAPVIKRNASSAVIQRSDEYLTRIDDLQVNFTTSVIRAKVNNGRGDTYDVKWNLDSRRVSCTCPAHRNRITLPCKHAVAVFRKVYHEFN